MLFDCYASMCDFVCCGRFLPVAVFAIAWLSKKIRLGNAAGEHGESSAYLSQRIKRGFGVFAYGVKRCIRGSTDVEQSSREMQMQQRSDTDELKRSLIA